MRRFTSLRAAPFFLAALTSPALAFGADDLPRELADQAPREWTRPHTPSPVPGPGGRPTQLIDVASIAVLEKSLNSRGVDASHGFLVGLV